LLLLGIPLAWWLARTRWRGRVLVEAVVAMPLVLPPTVLGFYLLVLLGPRGALGGLVQVLGGPPLAFSFGGLLIGSVIYSMPFVVQPLQSAFAALGERPLEAAATLRAGPLDRFFSVALPLARPGLVTGAVLGFAHTLGEFGVVLMIGGNIPGRTQVLSIAIYDHVEALEYGAAHVLSACLLGVAFVMLVAVYAVNRRFAVART
jgi:molybdate transport system permease protein